MTTTPIERIVILRKLAADLQDKLAGALNAERMDEAETLLFDAIEAMYPSPTAEELEAMIAEQRPFPRIAAVSGDALALDPVPDAPGGF